VNGTQWVAENSLTITVSQLNLTVPLVVVGNFTVASNDTTFIATYIGGVLFNISGEADLRGTLLLLLPPGLALNQSQVILIGYAADLVHGFDQVKVQSANGCVRYTAEPLPFSAETSSFGVLIGSVTNTCTSRSETWWVPVVVIGCAILAVLLLLAIGVYLQRRGYLPLLYRKITKRRVYVEPHAP